MKMTAFVVVLAASSGAYAQSSNPLTASATFHYRIIKDYVTRAAVKIVKFDAIGEGARVPVQMPPLTVLAFHTAHAFEHYGNLVTYMRIRRIVPPSSEPPFGVYKPPQ